MGDELLRTDNSQYMTALEEHGDTVYRICLVYLKNKADAEDVFQTVFLKLCEAKPSFHDAGHCRAWLITVARNECKNTLRSFWRRRVTCVEEIILPVEDGTDRQVVRAVLALPVKYRDVVYLFYYEGYKIGELAAMLGLKEPTVKTRLRRGRQLLKTTLTEGALFDEEKSAEGI